MFFYEKKLQYPVKIATPNPKLAAMIISYTTWHSIGWAIFHGMLSWLYVIYFILRY